MLRPCRTSSYLVYSAAVTGLIKLALQAGKANPAPPVGPALGAKVPDLLRAIQPDILYTFAYEHHFCLGCQHHGIL